MLLISLSLLYGIGASDGEAPVHSQCSQIKEQSACESDGSCLWYEVSGVLVCTEKPDDECRALNQDRAACEATDGCAFAHVDSIGFETCLTEADVAYLAADPVGSEECVAQKTADDCNAGEDCTWMGAAETPFCMSNAGIDSINHHLNRESPPAAGSEDSSSSEEEQQDPPQGDEACRAHGPDKEACEADEAACVFVEDYNFCTSEEEANNSNLQKRLQCNAEETEEGCVAIEDCVWTTLQNDTICTVEIDWDAIVNAFDQEGMTGPYVEDMNNIIEQMEKNDASDDDSSAAHSVAASLLLLVLPAGMLF